LPALPFGFCALLLAAASYGLTRVRAQARAPQLADAEIARDEQAALRLSLGSELAAALETGALEPAIREVREQLFQQLGLRFGLLALRTADGSSGRGAAPELHGGARLAARGYAIELHEAPLARGEVEPAAAPARAAEAVAAALGVQVRRHAGELFGLEHAQRWLDELERAAPALVRTWVPKPIALPLLGQVLRRLLAEGVSIRPRERILEALGAAAGDGTSDAATLTERVRVQLRRQITHAAARDGVLALHALDPLIEDALRDAAGAGNGVLALPPDQARDIVAAVRALPPRQQEPTVLISQPDVRRHLRALLEAELPDVRVLSYPELAPDVQVEQRERVRIG
jgi:type III secretion protein V